MVQCPVNKQFYFALCTVNGGLSSERVKWANLHVFINKISNWRSAMIIQVLHLFIQEIATKDAFFFSFYRVFTLYIPNKYVGNLIVN